MSRRAPPRSVSVRNYGDPIAADPPGGWGGWGLGKPHRTVWPTARPSGAGTPGPTYDAGVPQGPPPPPPPSPGGPGGSPPPGGRVSCAPPKEFGPPTPPP